MERVKSSNQLLNWANNKNIETRKGTLEGILSAVSKYTGIDENIIKGNIRHADVVVARKAFCHIARKSTNEAASKIAKFINIHHSTELYYNRIDSYRYDGRVRRVVDGCYGLLDSNQFIGVEERLLMIRDHNDKFFKNYIKDNLLGVTYHGKKEAAKFLNLVNRVDKYLSCGRFEAYPNPEYSINGVSVHDKKTDIIYNSISSASRATGVDETKIGRQINYNGFGNRFSRIK